MSGDAELFGIVAVSLTVSLTATVLASMVCIPLFTLLGLEHFRGERAFSRFLNVLMSIPSVLIGLVVTLVLARRGPLGYLQLLYTKKAMIIAQTILITPIVSALAFDRSRGYGRKFLIIGKTLGAGKLRASFLAMSEMRQDILIIVITAFSRAISEVGAVMMVGGNIKGQTRVMTTALSMHNSMGDYAMAIAIGIVLLLTALLINGITIFLRED